MHKPIEFLKINFDINIYRLYKGLSVWVQSRLDPCPKDDVDDDDDDDDDI